MELRQLQTFITITQVQNFSKAAELLGYSQSAVTIQIRLLEEELGIKLFDRMGKKVTLTSHGRQFAGYAHNMIHEMNRAKHFLRKEKELYNPLHIGTLDSLCFSKLPSILHNFQQNHPKVPIRITTASPKELIELMEYNQLDLIYILDRPRHNENWHKIIEVQEPIVFVASSSSKLAGKRGLSLEELLEKPFFLTEKGENYRRELDHYLETRGKTLTPLLEIDSTEFIIRMIQENRGISYLPHFTVRECEKKGLISVLDVPEFQRVMYRQIFYHKNKWKTEEMEYFMQLAKMDMLL